MRHLVACPLCKRQYDATGRDPGDRFHCHCGQEIEIPTPRPHSASVVRCSSCGATRQSAVAACGHCGSDFTLHERDLHTICPGCMARVSDHATYCHHCALRLDPQEKAGETTKKICPACEDQRFLTSRDFGVENLSIFECPRCAGLWLGHPAFRHLVERAAVSPVSADVHAAAAARAEARKTGPIKRVVISDRLYRKCIECDQLMHRRNYDKKSGVIIDVCGDHGAWFDSDELAAILRWIRDGGSLRTQEREAELRAENARRARPGPLPRTFAPSSEPTSTTWSPTLIEFLLQVAAALVRVMR